MSGHQLDLLARGTLPRAWTETWAMNADSPALFDPQHGWVTFADLEEDSRRVAGRLRSAGIAPGDRMVFSAGASLELVITHVAALRAGIVVVPVNTAYRQQEIEHIVKDAEPRAALVDDDERAAWIRTAAGTDIVLLGPEVARRADAADAPDGAEGLDAPEDLDAPEGLDAADPHEAALIGYTSGTTGAPKGAVLSHANLLAGSESVGLAWRWTSTDRLILALPLFHVHGLCVGLHGALLAGASVVLLPRFDVDLVLDAAVEHQATMFFGVPTMYHRLVRSPRIGELARLRLCVSGSAALPAELHQVLADTTGQQVLERYGMTETLMLVSNPYAGERRAGTVGLPLPGVELRLSDGDEGEIQVRGPNVFAGYWERPQETHDAFTGGWFRTGDLGTLEADGYLRIRGRAKDLIITGGLNVYPREVEEVLLTHPHVAEVAVTGAPSEEWGEVVTAYVVPAGQQRDAEPLLVHAAERLASFKLPRAVHFIDRLPRNALGKVLKHQLTATAERPGTGADAFSNR